MWKSSLLQLSIYYTLKLLYKFFLKLMVFTKWCLPAQYFWHSTSQKYPRIHFSLSMSLGKACPKPGIRYFLTPKLFNVPRTLPFMPTKAGPIFQCWQRKAFIPYLKTSRLFPTPTFTICLVASFHHSREMVLLQGAKNELLAGFPWNHFVRQNEQRRV